MVCLIGELCIECRSWFVAAQNTIGFLFCLSLFRGAAGGGFRVRDCAAPGRRCGKSRHELSFLV
jgi:hypothetical protein